MSSPRCWSLLLLLVVGAALCSPLLAEDTCDDSCSDHCGDCASCPLVAELHGTVTSVHRISAALAPLGESSAQPDRSRPLDHVPLLPLF